MDEKTFFEIQVSRGEGLALQWRKKTKSCKCGLIKSGQRNSASINLPHKLHNLEKEEVGDHFCSGKRKVLSERPHPHPSYGDAAKETHLSSAVPRVLKQELQD